MRRHLTALVLIALFGCTDPPERSDTSTGDQTDTVSTVDTGPQQGCSVDADCEQFGPLLTDGCLDGLACLEGVCLLVKPPDCGDCGACQDGNCIAVDDGKTCALTVGGTDCAYSQYGCKSGSCVGTGPICDNVNCSDSVPVCGNAGCATIRIGCGNTHTGSLRKGYATENTADYGVACGSLIYSYPEVLYLFEADDDDEVTVTLASETGVHHALILPGDTCTASSCKSLIEAGQNKTLTVTKGELLAIAVEGFSEAADAYTISVTCKENPDGAGFCPEGHCGPDGAGGECASCSSASDLDTCATAGALTFVSGQTSGSVAGNTSSALGDYELAKNTCTQGETEAKGFGPDHVYSFTALDEGYYAFELNGESSFDTVLVSLDSLEACTAGVLSGCPLSTDVEGTSGERLDRKMAAGETTFLIVDGANTQHVGDYTLGLTQLSCDGVGVENLALHGTLDAGNTATINFLSEGSMLWDLPANHGCAGLSATAFRGSGAEGVFTYTPPTSGGYTVTAQPTGTNSDVLVYVVSCLGATTSTCVGAADTAGTADEELTFQAVGGQTYYVIVENVGDPGSVTVVAGACDPACGDKVCGADACGGSCGNCAASEGCALNGNKCIADGSWDNCDEATSVLVDGSVQGYTGGGSSFFDPTDTCDSDTFESSMAKDQLVSFTPLKTAFYTFSLESENHFAGLYLTSSCAAGSLTCTGPAAHNPNGLAELTVELTADNTVWAVVDGTTDEQGVWRLAVKECLGCRAGDVCTNALPISTSETAMPVMGDTSLFTDDIQCDGQLAGIGASDLVYQVAIATAGDYLVDVLAEGWTPHVTVTQDCSNVTECTDNQGQVLFSATAATTWFVHIDGLDTADKGPFSLTISPAPVSTE